MVSSYSECGSYFAWLRYRRHIEEVGNVWHAVFVLESTMVLLLLILFVALAGSFVVPYKIPGGTRLQVAKGSAFSSVHTRILGIFHSLDGLRPVTLEPDLEMAHASLKDQPLQFKCSQYISIIALMDSLKVAGYIQSFSKI